MENHPPAPRIEHRPSKNGFVRSSQLAQFSQEASTLGPRCQVRTLSDPEDNNLVLGDLSVRVLCEYSPPTRKEMSIPGELDPHTSMDGFHWVGQHGTKSNTAEVNDKSSGPQK